MLHSIHGKRLDMHHTWKTKAKTVNNSVKPDTNHTYKKYGSKSGTRTVLLTRNQIWLKLKTPLFCLKPHLQNTLRLEYHNASKGWRAFRIDKSDRQAKTHPWSYYVLSYSVKTQGLKFLTLSRLFCQMPQCEVNFAICKSHCATFKYKFIYILINTFY